jgi:Tol biopolymer transport system component
MTGAWVAAGAFLGGVLTAILLPRPVAQSVTLRTLTFSGTDFAPSVSPDGHTLAFISQRDGTSRIWLKQLESGNETALTPGPTDRWPRFSNDGSWILYVSGKTLYRISPFGGEARKLLENIESADWSPDSHEIVFLREESADAKSTTLVGIASAQDGSSRIIHRFENENFGPPAWSPDGQTIALSPQGLGNAGPVTKRYVVLLSRTGEDVRRLECALPGGTLSLSSWSGSGDEVIYELPDSAAEAGVAINTTVGSSGRVLAQNVRTGKVRFLFAVQAPLSRVEIAGQGRMIFDSLSQRNNLKETYISPSSAGQDHWLTHGNSIDRQPFYSPDGESVVFSSSRSGVDLWDVSVKTNSLRRLTDHPAADWDPFVTRDGKYLLWSSNRTGLFEIWMADRDGSAPRQISHDGYDAENPVMSSDGWIIYVSSNPEHLGLWKIRSDGTQAKLVVPGSTSWPDLSPDGQFVLYHTIRADLHGSIAVARVLDGSPLNFTAEGSRGRFSGDGHSIVFINYEQDKIISKPFPSEAGAPVKVLLQAPADQPIETFGISADGKRLVISYPERNRSLVVADGVAGISPPERVR